VAIIEPNWPGFVIVNVAPWTSSGLSWRERARRARSRMRRERPSGAAHDGHDQPVLPERDGDAEVDLLVHRVDVVLQPGVEQGELHERADRAARDERQRGDGELLARDLDARDVDLDPGRAGRRRHLRLLHMHPDGLAHARQRTPLGRRVRAADGRAGAGAIRALDVHDRLGSISTRRARRRPAACGEHGHDVLLLHAALAAGALDLGEVDAVLVGDPLDDRAVAARRAPTRRGRDAPFSV
jgi:hypothetical protein